MFEFSELISKKYNDDKKFERVKKIEKTIKETYFTELLCNDLEINNYVNLRIQKYEVRLEFVNKKTTNVFTIDVKSREIIISPNFIIFECKDRYAYKSINEVIKFIKASVIKYRIYEKSDLYGI